MEYTPGPWKTSIWKDGDSHQGNRIMAADGFEVANLSYTGAQEDQDARLIAEAPNMLDALKDVAAALAPIKEGKRDGATFGNLSIAADTVEAAIKAATSPDCVCDERGPCAHHEIHPATS